MASKILALILISVFSFVVCAEEKKLNVEVTATPENKSLESDLLMLDGYKKALEAEMTLLGLKHDEFTSKLETKKKLSTLTVKESLEIFKGLFSKAQLEVHAGLDMKEPPAAGMNKTSGNLIYEIDPARLSSFVKFILSDLPDETQKNFYLAADIEIEEGLSWEELGVTKAESFSGVIKDSWKKLAIENVKGFDNYVLINKDLETSELMNPKSVVLKWKSRLKKSYEDKERKTAKFELTAQYVLVNAKTGMNLLAFDFPEQKREYSLENTKALSSGLASLIYNLLNSQTSKLNTAIETAMNAQLLNLEEFKITGPHGLTDLYQAISWINENMKEHKVFAELKTYASPGSVLVVKTSEPLPRLIQLFSQNGGRMIFNEQKILVFNPTDKTFAIIPKDGNN